jgi:hypothetical protein
MNRRHPGHAALCQCNDCAVDFAAQVREDIKVGLRCETCGAKLRCCQCDKWNKTHTHYYYRGGWYTVVTYVWSGYSAEVMGQWADGDTPAHAIENAARKHQPQPATAEEFDEREATQ